MKRLVIGALTTLVVAASAPALADENWRAWGGPGAYERTFTLPAGPEKNLLQVHYRRDHPGRYHPKYGLSKHPKWHRKYHNRHGYRDDRRSWGKPHKGDGYRERHHRQHWHRHHKPYPSGYHGIRLGYDDGLSREARIGRIIHDTYRLIDRAD